ncbi:hypothetical protein MLD38_035408 [Melastoma candidum]|uniref:Uncharacterized protein n=1 Tax=Melastoma candidum TaxID=119954 RepID=A0ACB9LH21_9MYRT|nr:hypothetical protein MLD38_035408 [Melastoma candidum]
MAVAGRPNGGALEEGDNVEGQKYRFLEEGGLEDQLDYHASRHLSTFVAAKNQDVDALRNALGNSMPMKLSVASGLCRKDVHFLCLHWNQIGEESFGQLYVIWLNDMDIDINEAVEACVTALHLACPCGPLPCVQVIRISSNICSVLLEVHISSRGCWIQTCGGH